MIKLRSVHHLAIICSDYPRSKKFYTELLGFTVIAENYREDRRSFKLDLKLDDQYRLELFSFPDAPPRLTRPEACGLRHLAFAVEDIEAEISSLTKLGIKTE